MRVWERVVTKLRYFNAPILSGGPNGKSVQTRPAIVCLLAVCMCVSVLLSLCASEFLLCANENTCLSRLWKKLEYRVSWTTHTHSHTYTHMHARARTTKCNDCANNNASSTVGRRWHRCTNVFRHAPLYRFSPCKCLRLSQRSNKTQQRQQGCRFKIIYIEFQFDRWVLRR